MHAWRVPAIALKPSVFNPSTAIGTDKEDDCAKGVVAEVELLSDTLLEGGAVEKREVHVGLLEVCIN